MTEETYRARKLRSDNTSGYTGVQRTRSGKWHVFITVEGQLYHLGNYIDIQTAARVRRAAENLVLSLEGKQDALLLKELLSQV